MTIFCPMCGHEDLVVRELYEYPIDATTGEATTDRSSYDIDDVEVICFDCGVDVTTYFELGAEDGVWNIKAKPWVVEVA